MHVLKLKTAVPISKTIGTLEPGDYLLHDINAFEIAAFAPRDTAKVSDHGWNMWLNQDAENTLIMRSGAIGDLLMLMPALAAWKAKTGRKVAVSCFKHHWPVLENNGIVDEILPYPLPFSEVNRFSEIISLENTMELDNQHHITDVFAKALGVETPLKDYRPAYQVTPQEKLAALKHLYIDRPNIALQIRASVANRDYPPIMWLDVISKLEKKGWGVLLLGRKGQIPPIPPNLASPFIRDLSALDLSLRESVAVLGGSHAMIGVDSAFLHFANALDVPAIGLFGPFDWQIRTSKAPKTQALMGTGECARCSWHMTGGRQFPPNKPCSQIQTCVVLASIQPDRIVARAGLLKP